MMTRFLSVGALVATLAPLAVAQTAPAPPKPDVNPLNRTVEAPVPATASSEALHTLAKNVGASLMSDADDVDKAPKFDGPAPTIPEGVRRLRGRLNDWSTMHNLNWKQTNGALLAWSAPDPFALVNQWKAQDAPKDASPAAPPAKTEDVAKTTPPGTPQIPAGMPQIAAATKPPEPPKLLIDLSRFFATPAARRIADNLASWRDMPVAQLPDEIRQEILAIAPPRPQEITDTSDMAQSAVLGDEFWKTATLRVQNIDLPMVGADGKPEHHPSPILFLTGRIVSATGSGTVMLGIAPWPKP